MQAPFGFVTGCHAGDKFMVQAALVRSLTLFKSACRQLDDF
jgi:hypothetical protein